MPARPAAALGSSRKPRYVELADTLREELFRGAFPHGFPTESVLCTRFGVSRFTVREALRALQGEGLIQRKRGSGTIIQPPAARGGALHQPLSNVGELLQYARDTRFAFDRQADSGIPPAIETAIGIDHGGRWVHFVGVRTGADGVPLALTHAWLHESLEHIADDLKPSADPIFRQVERMAGVRTASVTQDIQACAADDETARLLDVESGAPVLRIIRCYIDGDGRTFEISASHHPGERFAYAMHIEVDG